MCVAAACLAVLAFAGVASATPTIALRAKVVPIPGFPGTGNYYGAGAAVEYELTIKGTEYGGYQPPLIGVKVFLPQGVKLHPAGFPTCPQQTIEAKEPEKCPKKSAAGPRGYANGFVVFGTERVPETVSIEGFYAKGGGLNFVVLGHTPASIEIVSVGHYAQLNGGGGYGPEGIVEVPLIQTVPGAADASAEKIVGKLGSAIKQGKKTLYYGTLPTKCPKHHMTAKVELTFAENGDISTPVSVPLTYNLPCPTKPRKK
jgi:hypothetical protein